ncbi:hypothetical protein TNCV_3410901 [Trichonephila clavipes]|nr:hypothetical protein TNCV_3410901 [Trichonephila clavipes]
MTYQPMTFISLEQPKGNFSNSENRRNRFCNHPSLPPPLNQSGDSHSSRPIHIRPHLTFSIWDGGTHRVPFPSDDQRRVFALPLAR